MRSWPSWLGARVQNEAHVSCQAINVLWMPCCSAFCVHARQSAPCTSRSRAASCCTCPTSSTLSDRPCRCCIATSACRFGPSPPIMKRTLLYSWHSAGITRACRSMPLRYTSLLSTTILHVLRTAGPRPGVLVVGRTESALKGVHILFAVPVKKRLHAMSAWLQRLHRSLFSL